MILIDLKIKYFICDHFCDKEYLFIKPFISEEGANN